MGVDAHSEKQYSQPAVADNGAVCFEVPSNYEITVAGKKLVGSAQARKYQGVLQHGSIPLYGDISRIIDVLKYPGEQQRLEAKQRVLSRAATVSSITSQFISLSQAVSCFKQAFQVEFELDFMDGTLTQLETNLAFELQQSKYAHRDWIERV